MRRFALWGMLNKTSKKMWASRRNTKKRYQEKTKSYEVRAEVYAPMFIGGRYCFAMSVSAVVLRFSKSLLNH
jgi:hypothetical protein